VIGLFLLAAASTSQMNLVELQSLCADDRSGCELYILGVTEGVSLAAGLAKDHTRFCIPDDVSEMELTDIVLQSAKADLARFPRDKTLPASSFVGAAITRRYPCRR
jgi:hypothetical protein